MYESSAAAKLSENLQKLQLIEQLDADRNNFVAEPGTFKVHSCFYA
ncbi:MAG: hypothetical protein WA708_15720 [Acidobacteriaceae bacterium]